MAERERTPALNPAEPTSLDEMAVWGSIQVAHLFGIEPLDLTGVTYDFVNTEHRRRRRNPMAGVMGSVTTGRGEPQQLKINTAYADADRGLLLHEMAHVYMRMNVSEGNRFPSYDDSWFQESMADYTKIALGYGRPYRGDPTEGYSKGARFLFWLESQYPTAVGRIGQRMIAGQDPYSAVSDETGQPIPVLLAVYQGFPDIPHATGPMAEYLRPPRYTPEERAQMRLQPGRIDIINQQLAWGPVRRKYGGYNDWGALR